MNDLSGLECRAGSLRPGLALFAYFHMGEWTGRRVWMRNGELCTHGPIPVSQWELTQLEPFPSMRQVFGRLGYVTDEKRSIFDHAIYHAARMVGRGKLVQT